MKGNSMNDLCIRCGKETEYSQSTPVDKRYFYVTGSGQMCEDCYRGVYALGYSELEANEE